MRFRKTDSGINKMFYAYLISIVFMVAGTESIAQYRPSLFFREDWKEIPAATPVTHEHLSNNDLILRLYGPGCDSIKKSHHETPADDPFYVWSGLCQGNWVVALKHNTSYVDLSGFSKVVWRSKQSGLRSLYLVIKLADGTWLVSNQGDSTSKDWRVKEINIMDLSWYLLNIKDIIEAKPVANVNLSRVDEIGFTDLMTGGDSDACSRLDWIEVYGKPVLR